MPFPLKYAIVRTEDGRNFSLVQELVYNTNSGIAIIVTPNSETDGASTPSFIWDIIPPFGKYWLAAIVHDYLYRYTKYSKEFCDNVLLEAMTDLNVEEVEKIAIYEAVKLAGKSSFSKDRNG